MILKCQLDRSMSQIIFVLTLKANFSALSLDGTVPIGPSLCSVTRMVCKLSGNGILV